MHFTYYITDKFWSMKMFDFKHQKCVSWHLRQFCVFYFLFFVVYLIFSKLHIVIYSLLIFSLKWNILESVVSSSFTKSQYLYIITEQKKIF